MHKLRENRVEKVDVAGFSSLRDRVQGVRPPHGPAQQAVQGEPTSTHLYILRLCTLVLLPKLLRNYLQWNVRVKEALKIKYKLCLKKVWYWSSIYNGFFGNFGKNLEIMVILIKMKKFLMILFMLSCNWFFFFFIFIWVIWRQRLKLKESA